ncbi:MAG: isocitrate dehydrogenase, partial [Actinomycetota bacterium]|nr:isocitrate dehydrogenase [Actinomycetota bacterium]
SADVTTVALFEGEDASPEAVGPVIELLDSLGLGLDWVRPDPRDAIAAIDAADCAFFGATSGASAAALFHLRWGRSTYANVRPVRFIEGARSPMARPAGIDFVIVRENLEDLYVAAEGSLADLAEPAPRSRTMGRPVSELGPGRFAIKAITEAGSDRVIRYAFELARRRPRKHLTVSAKFNMLPQTDGLFVEIGRSIATEYTDVELEVLIVDDLAHRLVVDPHRFDVIVLPNLYGDILSDLAAGLVGGLGLAPSGCYGETYAYFEPAHGTAPDLAGTGRINPTATLLSACMMLEHLGMDDVASGVVAAIERVYARGVDLTADQGGSGSAASMCAAIRSEVG